MRDIPDNVIERLLDEIPDAKWDRLIDQIDYEIAKALPDLDLPRDICEDILCVAINETAPVIAAWARQQERERIGRALNEADAALAAAHDDERAYWEGNVDALASILNQEGEQ